MGGGATAAGSLSAVVTPAPTAPTLPAGTLGASVSASLPAAVVGGAKAGQRRRHRHQPQRRGRLRPGHRDAVRVARPSLGGATQLLAVTQKLKLKAGARKAIRLKISSFPSLPRGTYYLIASVKAPDGTTTGAAGPSLTISPAFVSVVASGVRPLAASVAPGRKAALALTLTGRRQRGRRGNGRADRLAVHQTPPAPPAPRRDGARCG